MKTVLTILVIVFSIPLLRGQKVLDTVKVYNVYCSYSSGNSFIGWGGNWTEFYPSEECDTGDKKYIDNYTIVSNYMKKRVFFWMKLYNKKDQLIFEGLKYSDCQIGKFILYWPNGKVKLTGEYDGYKYSKITGYKLKKCSGKKKGAWVYFNEEGEKLNTITY